MLRKILWFAFFLLPLSALAQTGAVQNHCYLGGTNALTSGLKSTNFQNGVIPACTVTVFLTGTTTKATIYADGISTPLANPFTSNTASSVDPGGWIFWAATNQGLDVVMSGGMGNPACTTAPNCYTQPVTLTDVFAGGGGGGGGDLPTATFAGSIPLSQLNGSNVYVIAPNEYRAQTSDTISSLNAKCASAPCTMWVNSTVTDTITGNTSLNSNVNLVFGSSGTLNITSSGGSFNLTIPGTIQGDSQTQHFAGSAGYVFSPGTKAWMEWCGAVGNFSWSGGTPTDDHVAIQNCGNYVIAGGGGELHGHLKGYYLGTSSVTFVGSNFALIGEGNGFPFITGGGPGTAIQNTTQLVNSSATAAQLICCGTSTSSANIGWWDRIENISTARTVAPTGDPDGMFIRYTNSLIFNHNHVSDGRLHILYDPAGNTGSFENSQTNHCYNGFGYGTSGTNFTGWFLDPAQPFTSLRMFNDGDGVNTGVCPGSTAGFQAVQLGDGTNPVNDVKIENFESSTSKVCFNIQGGGGSYGAGDVQILSPICDGNMDTGFEISGFTSTNNGSLVISGGRLNGNLGGGTGQYGISCLNSRGLKVTGMEIIDAGTVAAINMNGCFDSILDNTIDTWAGADGIDLSSAHGNSIRGTINGKTGATLLKLTNSSGNAIAALTMGGVATNGVIADSSSNQNKSFSNIAFDPTATITNPLTGDAGTGNQFGGYTPPNGINETTSFTASSGGNYRINCASACTGTLPASIITGYSAVFVSVGSGAFSVATGGPTYDGYTGTLLQGSAIEVWTDGTGYHSTSPIAAASPIVVSFVSGALQVSCPTCGTSTATAANINGGSTIGTLSMNGDIPLACQDTSGSGTVQVCNTSPTFTPVAPNCVDYTTTTANTGTALTININSLGAKSAAIPGSSGWTTTLTAGAVPANTPISACYNGTNWNLSGTGIQASGGGGSYPAPTVVTCSGLTCAVTGCITSSNRDYEIRLSDIAVSNAGDVLVLQFSTNNGSTWDTGSSTYAWAGNYLKDGSNTTGTLSGSNGTAGTNISLGLAVPTTSNMAYNATLALNDPLGTGNWKAITGLHSETQSSDGSNYMVSAFFSYHNANAVNAFRLVPYTGASPSSHNITGTITCQPKP